MFVEVVEASRCAVFFDISRRGVSMDLHVEQRPADQVAMLRLARPDRYVGFAHGDVELILRQDQPHADVGIHVQKLAQALGNPNRAEPCGRGDTQVTGRFCGRVRQHRLGAGKLIQDLARRPVKQVALLG